MSKYLKPNKPVANSPALKTARRHVYWQAGLALTTIVLTIVIIFAMTSAWYTNIVQTSGLVFEAEAWGFSGEIVIGDQSVEAAPGDEGVIHLEVTNSNDSMTAIGISASKSNMESVEMQKRLFFYVDAPTIRNGEVMERVYLNSQSNYTYMLFGESSLTLTEEAHNDAPLKWHWVYDMLGYYVLGSYTEDRFTEFEYLRPVEYDYDAATFDYVTDENDMVTIELKTVDGITTVEEFLQGLSETDGFENPIDIEHPVAEGYYPVEVDEEGYGVYVYLCSAAEIVMATNFDTQLGQQAAEGYEEGEAPSYPVTLSVTAQMNDEDVIPVTNLTSLNSAISQLSGSTIQLAEDLVLTGGEKIVIPTGTQIIVDLNEKTITSQTGGNVIEAKPGSSVIFLNGSVEGDGRGNGIHAVGAEVTLNKVSIDNFDNCIFVADGTDESTLDSKVHLVDCEITAADCAVLVYGNGTASELKTQLIIDSSKLMGDGTVIMGNASTTEHGRWGTDIQIINSEIISNAEKVFAGIYHPQKDSNLTIYNSTVSGYTGLAIKGGNISVKGSHIIGNGAALNRDPKPGNSGWDDTGDGIYIEANYGYDIRLEISDIEILEPIEGTEEFKTTTVTSKIESKHNQALRVWELDAANVTVRIYSGEFDTELPAEYIAAGSVQSVSGGKYVVKLEKKQ